MSTTTSRLGERKTLASIEGLSFRYPDAQRDAVKDFSLDIGEGEVVLLAGPSGCGKSTLLRCVNGLIPHMYPGDYRGRVSVGGLKVAETPMGTLSQNVGFLFQNPENQIFMFSVERDVAFGLQNLSVPRGEMRSRVDEAMRLLGVSDLALRAPHELSDGQKQRAALAGVIAMRPKLIILDEPTSLLDPKTALEVVSLIERLNRELGITFIVVEHRLELAHPRRPQAGRDGRRVKGDGRGPPGRPRGGTGRVLWGGRPSHLEALQLALEGRHQAPQGPRDARGDGRGAEPAMTLIEFRDVSFVHRTGVTALSDVSLTIGNGETIAIVGENGAGKTTLVRHTNGLLKPTKGAVLVDGVNTRETTTATLSRKVGIAFQNPDHQLFSESVENEVRFAMRNFGFAEELVLKRLDWALNFFGLEQYRKSSPLVLSGGRRRGSPSPASSRGTRRS